MAPIPASRGEVDLPNLQGFPRRPQPAPPPPFPRAGIQVRRGGREPGQPSRLSTSGFPSLEPQPSFFLPVPGTGVCAGPRPSVRPLARTREGVGFGSQAPPLLAMHPSWNPRPTCSLFPHSLSEGRGHPEAVTALQGQRQELDRERGEQLQARWLMPVETRSSSGEGPTTKTQEPVTTFSEFSLLKGASWYI